MEYMEGGWRGRGAYSVSSGRDMVSFGGKMLITVELAYVFLMSSTLPFPVKPLEFKVDCSKKLEGRCEFRRLGIY